MPALVKILVVFVLILLLSRTRVHLSFSLFLGTLVLGFWSGLSFGEVSGVVGRGLTDRTAILLSAIMVLILFLSRLMEQSGNLNRIIQAFSRVVRGQRALSALIPALVGILPLPGGALFSAPLVATAVQETDLTAARKVVINYWFRHVWEYWWPLYPGFILAAGLLEISAVRLMIFQIPLAIFAAFSGWLFLLRPLKNYSSSGPRPSRSSGLADLFRESVPIVGILVVIFLFNLLIRLTASVSIPPEIPVLAGVAAGIILVCWRERLGPDALLRALRGGKYLHFVLLVAAIMIFRGVLDESGAVLQVREELLDYRIPVLLVVIFLPFFSGLITGIAIGFVGASFPVILPLLADLGPTAFLVHGILAFGCGYMGMMLSPVHLCLLFSRDYFEASLAPCYRLLFPLVGLTLLLGGLYFIIFSRLIG